MASNLSTVEYIVDQINGIGIISYKKMFGEYLIRLNDKPIFLVCDDTLFVKVLPKTSLYLENKKEGKPYPSCKTPYYIVEDLDNRQLLINLALAVEEVTALPTKRRKKDGSKNKR